MRFLVQISLIAALSMAPAGCASARAKRGEQQALFRADGLVLQGCHACLIEARDLYAAAASRRRPPAVLQRLFEVELLVALREKELGMDARGALDRARVLSLELPAGVEAGRYLQLAEAVLPDDIGTPKHERNLLARRMANREQMDRDRLWLETGWLAADVRQYISLALDCSNAPRPSPADALPNPGSRTDLPPLLLYRTGVCSPSAGILAWVRSEVPRFTEAAFFQGRVALQAVQTDGGKSARAFMREAYADFPRSPAVTYMNGSVNQLAGDCRAALRFYDETLALRELHEDALLGRTACLSYLKKSDAAIATATRLIDMKAYNYGDAFYWRAWNRHQRGELPPARADIDRAKTLRYSSSVLTLAGMIDYDQDDLAPATADLKVAKDLDGANCIARWYLALVELRREAWATTASHFADAMTCYDASAKATEARTRILAAREDLDPEWRAGQLAGFEAAIDEDRSQESASAYNAAVNFLRAGDRPASSRFADLAARDPLRLPKVEELRKLMLPHPP